MWPILAMIAASAIQAYSANQAAGEQQRLAVESQQRALAARNAATDTAMKRVQDFDPTTRADKQNTITTDLTNKFDNTISAPPVTAQGVQVGKTIDGGSSDYLTTQAKEQAKTAASLHALAGLMGRIGGANELRRGEAVGIGDTAGQIGAIQTGANNIGQIDQMGIQAAGAPNIGAMLASGALNAYGMNGMLTSGIGAGGGTAAGTGINAGSGSGLGLKSGIGFGLKAPPTWLS